MTANSQQPTANSQQPTANSQQPTANSQQPTANSQHITSKIYQTLKYLFIVISSIAILNCGNSSSTTVPSAEPELEPSNKPYKFQNNVIYGVDFETDSGQVGTISSDKGFEHNAGDEKITFKIKDLIIGEFNLTKLNADKILLVNDVVGVERDDTVNKNVLKILRVLQSLDNDNDLSNGIFIDDTTKNLLVGLSEGKTKITENDIYELKALMVKAGKTLVVEKKARDYYKTKVLTPAGITPKFNPFTLEVKTTSADEAFTLKVLTDINNEYASSFNYTVDWGDGMVNKNVTENITHKYTNAGTYTIKIYGDFPTLFLGGLFDTVDKKKVVQVLAWGDIAWQSFSYAFNDMNAKFSTTDTPDLSMVTNMINSFSRSTMSDIDFIEDWDVSAVTKMHGMFLKATNFNGNISNWDVSKVDNMESMFDKATNFNQDLSSWDVSRVTNMNAVFRDTLIFNQDLSSWDVSNATTMISMFNGASSFNQNLSGWNNKVSNVTNMRSMFENAKDFNQNLSGWDVTKVTVYGFFATGWGGSVDDVPPKFR